jgi:hypothetical protein
MKPFVKPRLVPLFGWAALILVGMFSAYVLYARPTVFLMEAPPPEAPAVEKDSIEQAMKNLAAIKASSWMQGGASYTDQALLAPAPDKVAVVEAPPVVDVEPADPSLKGAVVVTSGKRLYLVLGGKRFRPGQRIATGETIRTLNLQAVELKSPEGVGRTVEIGRAISPAAQQSTW